MRTCLPSPDNGTTWVDRVARHIHDPVTRLRFLKAVVPCPEDELRKPHRIKRFCVLALAAIAVMLLVLMTLSRLRASVPVQSASAPVPRVIDKPSPSVSRAADVWLVEKLGESDTYSNGLRIDNRYLVATHARSYLAFPMDGSSPVERSEPAGIVFHTTESQQAPFEARENRALKRIGESTLEFVRRRQAYNFVIDRFGRVYRIVAEDQVANHSGYSVWADENWSYLNLNQSFLAISFEAVSPGAQLEAEVSPAQVRSAAMLIEMLRHQYHIAASNCVTHAQVSVNPSNMRMGYHADWASGFPFESMGLPNNYGAALPSLWAYGFDYDADFARKAGERMRGGLADAEGMLLRKAAAAGLRPPAYKSRLRQRYRELLARARHNGVGSE